MFSKSTTCLLLTLMLLILAVPAYADGNPPPVPGDGNIHPWDNNDGARASGGPYIVQVGWMWLGNTSTGPIITWHRTSASQRMKSLGKSDKTMRNLNASQVVIRNR